MYFCVEKWTPVPPTESNLIIKINKRIYKRKKATYENFLLVPTGLKGTEAPWRGFHFPFPEARLPTRMETSSPGWGPRGPCTEKPPLGRDTGLGTLETQPGGAGPASGSSGLQVAAGLVLRSRPAASLAYSGPACFARAPRFRASRLGSSVPTPRVLPAKRVPV